MAIYFNLADTRADEVVAKLDSKKVVKKTQELIEGEFVEQ